MAGDDMTPDPLFKNVPRRPRSAASAYAARPRKEEPDGGHPSGSAVSSASAPATPAASNKRPSSTGGASENVPRAKKKRRLFPIPEPEDAKDHGGGAHLDRHGILGGVPVPPALSHKVKPDAAAVAASASSRSEAEPAVDWAENERCRKGKTLVVDDDDDACAAVACRPPESGLGKLLGDAIRSHESTAVAGFKQPSSRTKPKKPKEDRTKPKNAKKDRTKPKKKPIKDSSSKSAWFWCGVGRDGTSSAGSDVDYSFDRMGVVSDRLRTTLRGLGVAAAPERVYGRLLSRCDRTTHQARLQMSCKRWRADDVEFPLHAFLTGEERMEVHGKGLALTAYDRGGDAYELTLRFLGSITAYRLISNWSDFLRRNGLVVGKDEPATTMDDVMMDLWLFRPPGGKVGVVMLHYRRGDAAHADAVLDEVGKQKRLQLNNGDGRDGDDDDAVMEDVVGDANEENAGVMVDEVEAAAPDAQSSPSEPDRGGAIMAVGEPAGGPGRVPDVPSSLSLPEEPDGVGAKAAEEQAGALGEAAADAPSSSELDDRAPSDEVTAPSSSLAADGIMEEEQEAGALMVMVLEVEAATQSSLDLDAGGAVAAPPSSPEAEAGGGAAEMVATEDEAAAALAEAAARSWKVTKYEFQAAQALLMLSNANR